MDREAVEPWKTRLGQLSPTLGVGLSQGYSRDVGIGAVSVRASGSYALLYFVLAFLGESGGSRDPGQEARSCPPHARSAEDGFAVL